MLTLTKAAVAVAGAGLVVVAGAASASAGSGPCGRIGENVICTWGVGTHPGGGHGAGGTPSSGGPDTTPVSTNGKPAMTPQQWQAWCAAHPSPGSLCVIAVPQPGPGAPGAPAGPPRATPSVAAQEALAKLVLRRPVIGSAPCAGTGCEGTVGVPVWLWTQPWAQQSSSATAGPFTVTAHARIVTVTWDLGNGDVVTCTTAGTPYDTSMGWRASPDCGLPGGYQTAGRYTITATARWRVTWSGATSGSTVQTTTGSVVAAVGESQAIVVAE